MMTAVDTGRVRLLPPPENPASAGNRRISGPNPSISSDQCGVGITLTYPNSSDTDQRPVVASLAAGGPAASDAKIVVGDKLLKVSGQCVHTWPLSKVRQHIVGLPGTSLTLELEHNGVPFSCELTRSATALRNREVALRSLHTSEAADPLTQGNLAGPGEVSCVELGSEHTNLHVIPEAPAIQDLQARCRELATCKTELQLEVSEIKSLLRIEHSKFEALHKAFQTVKQQKASLADELQDQHDKNTVLSKAHEELLRVVQSSEVLCQEAREYAARNELGLQMSMVRLSEEAKQTRDALETVRQVREQNSALKSELHHAVELHKVEQDRREEAVGRVTAMEDKVHSLTAQLEDSRRSAGQIATRLADLQDKQQQYEREFAERCQQDSMSFSLVTSAQRELEQAEQEIESLKLERSSYLDERVHLRKAVVELEGGVQGLVMAGAVGSLFEPSKRVSDNGSNRVIVSAGAGSVFQRVLAAAERLREVERDYVDAISGRSRTVKAEVEAAEMTRATQTVRDHVLQHLPSVLAEISSASAAVQELSRAEGSCFKVWEDSIASLSALQTALMAAKRGQAESQLRCRIMSEQAESNARLLVDEMKELQREIDVLQQQTQEEQSTALEVATQLKRKKKANRELVGTNAELRADIGQMEVRLREAESGAAAATTSLAHSHAVLEKAQHEATLLREEVKRTDDACQAKQSELDQTTRDLTRAEEETATATQQLSSSRAEHAVVEQRREEERERSRCLEGELETARAAVVQLADDVREANKNNQELADTVAEKEEGMMRMRTERGELESKMERVLKQLDAQTAAHGALLETAQDAQNLRSQIDSELRTLLDVITVARADVETIISEQQRVGEEMAILLAAEDELGKSLRESMTETERVRADRDAEQQRWRKRSEEMTQRYAALEQTLHKAEQRSAESENRATARDSQCGRAARFAEQLQGEVSSVIDIVSEAQTAERRQLVPTRQVITETETRRKRTSEPAEMSELVAGFTEIVPLLERENDELAYRNRVLETEIDRVMGAMSELQSETAELKLSNKKLHEGEGMLKNHILAVQFQYKSAQGEVKRLREVCERDEMANVDMRCRLEGLEVTIGKHNQTLEHIARQAIVKQQSFTRQLKVAVEGQLAAEAATEEMERSTRSDIQKMREERGRDAEKTRAAHAEEVGTLQAILGTYSEECQGLKASLVVSAERMEELEREHREMAAILDDTRVALDDQKTATELSDIRSSQHHEQFLAADTARSRLEEKHLDLLRASQDVSVAMGTEAQLRAEQSLWGGSSIAEVAQRSLVSSRMRFEDDLKQMTLALHDLAIPAASSTLPDLDATHRPAQPSSRSSTLAAATIEDSSHRKAVLTMQFAAERLRELEEQVACGEREAEANAVAAKDAESRLAAATDEFAESKLQISDLLAAKEAVGEQIAVNETDLQTTRTELANAAERLCEVDGQLVESRKREESLGTELGTLKRELEETKEGQRTMLEQHERRIAAKTRVEREGMERQRVLEEQLCLLTAEHEEASGRRIQQEQGMREELERGQELFEQTAAQLASAQQEHEKMQQKLMDMEERHALQRRERDAACERLEQDKQSLETTISSLTDEAHRHAQMNEELAREAQEKVEAIQDMAKTAGQQQAKIDDLNVAVLELQESRQALLQQIEEAERSKHDLQQAASSLQDRLDAAGREREEPEVRAESQPEKVEQAQQTIEPWDGSLGLDIHMTAEAGEARQHAGDEVDDAVLKAGCEQYQTKVVELDAMLETYKEGIRRLLSNEYTEIADALSGADGEVGELVRALETCMEAKERELQGCKLEAQRLQTCVEEMAALHESHKVTAERHFEQERRLLHSELAEMQATLTACRSDRQHDDEELQAARAQLDKIQHEVESWGLERRPETDGHAGAWMDKLESVAAALRVAKEDQADQEARWVEVEAICQQCSAIADALEELNSRLDVASRNLVDKAMTHERAMVQCREDVSLYEEQVYKLETELAGRDRLLSSLLQAIETDSSQSTDARSRALVGTHPPKRSHTLQWQEAMTPGTPDTPRPAGVAFSKRSDAALADRGSSELQARASEEESSLRSPTKKESDESRDAESDCLQKYETMALCVLDLRRERDGLLALNAQLETQLDSREDAAMSAERISVGDHLRAENDALRAQLASLRLHAVEENVVNSQVHVVAKARKMSFEQDVEWSPLGREPAKHLSLVEVDDTCDAVPRAELSELASMLQAQLQENAALCVHLAELSRRDEEYASLMAAADGEMSDMMQGTSDEVEGLEEIVGRVGLRWQAVLSETIAKHGSELDKTQKEVEERGRLLEEEKARSLAVEEAQSTVLSTVQKELEQVKLHLNEEREGGIQLQAAVRMKEADAAVQRGLASQLEQQVTALRQRDTSRDGETAALRAHIDDLLLRRDQDQRELLSAEERSSSLRAQVDSLQRRGNDLQAAVSRERRSCKSMQDLLRGADATGQAVADAVNAVATTTTERMLSMSTAVHIAWGEAASAKRAAELGNASALATLSQLDELAGQVERVFDMMDKMQDGLVRRIGDEAAMGEGKRAAQEQLAREGAACAEAKCRTVELQGQLSAVTVELKRQEGLTANAEARAQEEAMARLEAEAATESAEEEVRRVTEQWGVDRALLEHIQLDVAASFSLHAKSLEQRGQDLHEQVTLQAQKLRRLREDADERGTEGQELLAVEAGLEEVESILREAMDKVAEEREEAQRGAVQVKERGWLARELSDCRAQLAEAEAERERGRWEAAGRGRGEEASKVRAECEEATMRLSSLQAAISAIVTDAAVMQAEVGGVQEAWERASEHCARQERRLREEEERVAVLEQRLGERERVMEGYEEQMAAMHGAMVGLESERARLQSMVLLLEVQSARSQSEFASHARDLVTMVLDGPAESEPAPGTKEIMARLEARCTALEVVLSRLEEPIMLLAAEREATTAEVVKLRKIRLGLEGELLALEGEYDAEQKLAGLLQSKVESLHALVSHHHTKQIEFSDLM